MSKSLPIKPFSDHHVPASTPRYVTLLNVGLIVIVAFALWGLMFQLIPMD